MPPPSFPFATRRSFLKAAPVAAVTLPSILRAEAANKAARRVNVAVIGVGGIGIRSVEGMKDENIVAFCDVDEKTMEKTFGKIEEMYPSEWNRMKGAPRFNDYRKMFDQVGGQIEAVTIAIPDHMHYPATVTALSLGKHVYCQKPLTHTVWEARELRRLAKEAKVITQMGNQGHAGSGCRMLREWIQGGVLGDVREVVSWTDRPGRFWPHVKGAPDYVGSPPPSVPSTLNWDAWQGIAAERPYDRAYCPKYWRGWWDFGTGPFGDVGCHIMDGAYWALDLGAPSALEAKSSGLSEQGTPLSSIVKMEFPARGTMPPVNYTWMDGGLKPTLPIELEVGRQLTDEAGTLIFGSKAVALCSFYYDSVRIIPETMMRDLARSLPPKTIPRVKGGPFAEWLRAIKNEGPLPGANFDYSGPFTEAVLLGNVAIRAQRRIEWDSAAMRVTNFEEANAYLRNEYRAGWM